LFENLEEQGAAARVLSSGLPVMTAGGNEMQISGTMTSMQACRHASMFVIKLEHVYDG
jgi:hypothetical protein